jgi:hypothetical protein
MPGAQKQGRQQQQAAYAAAEGKRRGNRHRPSAKEKVASILTSSATLAHALFSLGRAVQLNGYVVVGSRGPLGAYNNQLLVLSFY